ncbi:MAG: 16S rRNA (guanine(966)-N(2))-methyltransferase RsmD [Flavobacteriales bacterium]|jgi:16S rRNA (guanine(966)-N(2))-methyltransferase RsmD|nr:16S rRNA (guanine(966)-N(2))-methyltransferase RsmD [Flavobacteriales bacterium]MCB0758750.1 16S rRNA (guanine(966)-N(2))-methyltransferase RsmD [Flavobacteriales bacterium]
MRIVAGRFKGKRITPPKGITARPTTDFAKEALFNILQHSIALEGIRVLDLFAGSGGISLEFLSRGAEEVISVEQDTALYGHLQRTARELGTPNWHAVKADVFSYIKSDRSTYDVIFADPPFDMEGTESLPALIRESGLLAPDGLLLVEHYRRLDLSNDVWFDVCRKYSNINFSFFTPRSELP